MSRAALSIAFALVRAFSDIVTPPLVRLVAACPFASGRVQCACSRWRCVLSHLGFEEAAEVVHLDLSPGLAKPGFHLRRGTRPKTDCMAIFCTASSAFAAASLTVAPSLRNSALSTALATARMASTVLCYASRSCTARWAAPCWLRGSSVGSVRTGYQVASAAGTFGATRPGVVTANVKMPQKGPRQDSPLSPSCFSCGTSGRVRLLRITGWSVIQYRDCATPGLWPR